MSLCSKVGVAIISTDLSQLYKVTEKLVRNGIDFLHLDVNYEHFVPNLTFGPPVVKSLRKNLKDAYFEAHMMVGRPEQYIESMADAGADRYVFHIETINEQNIYSICRRIREAGMKCGIALKFDTDLEDLKKYVNLADMIMVMCTDIQDHILQRVTLKKIEWLRDNYPNMDIQADGAINLDNLDYCVQAGANIVVAGSGILAAKNQRKTIKQFRLTIEQYFPSLHKKSSNGLLSAMDCFSNSNSSSDFLYPIKNLPKQYLPKI